MSKEFKYETKVYYEDTDAGGVVYYANYLKFLERARTEALYSIGFSNTEIQDKFKTLIIVKSCNIEYKKPAYLEDELTINSFIKSSTKTSLFMNQVISKKNDITWINDSKATSFDACLQSLSHYNNIYFSNGYY